MIRLLLCIALIWGQHTYTFGQTIRRFHQTFDIEDVSAIQVATEGDVTVNTWSGNTVLVEIYVTSNVGPLAVVNLLQKEGRYDLDLQKSNTSTVVVVNKMKHKQNIKVKGQDMDETIRYTISIPDSFANTDTETMRSFSRTR